jgi:ankyrin repeat protein
MLNSASGFEWLLKKGADVNKRAAADSTPVLIGVIWLKNHGVREYSHMIKPILDAGADINVQDFKGKTPLMHAIEYCDWETAELLKTYVNKQRQISRRNSGR